MFGLKIKDVFFSMFVSLISLLLWSLYGNLTLLIYLGSLVLILLNISLARNSKKISVVFSYLFLIPTLLSAIWLLVIVFDSLPVKGDNLEWLLVLPILIFMIGISYAYYVLIKEWVKGVLEDKV
jgi:hypothetical protein